MFTYMKRDRNKKADEKWKELLKGKAEPCGSGQLLRRSFSSPMLKSSNEEYDTLDISDCVTNEGSSFSCQLENSSSINKSKEKASKGNNQRRLHRSHSYPELNYTEAQSLFIEVSSKTVADSDSSEVSEEKHHSLGLPPIQFVLVELSGGLPSIHNDDALAENDGSMALFQSPKSSFVESQTPEKQLFSTPLPSCSAHNLPVISLDSVKTSKVAVNNREQLNEPTAISKACYFENSELINSTRGVSEVCNENQQEGEEELCRGGTMLLDGIVTLSNESGNSGSCNNAQLKAKQNQNQDKHLSGERVLLTDTIIISDGSTSSCYLDFGMNPQQQNREESLYIKPSDKEGNVSPVQPVQEIQSCSPCQKSDNSSILIPPESSNDPPGTFDYNLSSRSRILAFCQQQEPINFDEGFNWESLICEKIGEGSFGNAYTLKTKGKRQTVIKVIPLAEESCSHTGKSSYEDVLPELIITRRLNHLATLQRNRTNNFVKLTSSKVYHGFYPNKLMYSWNRYYDHTESGYNPSCYLDNQEYLVLSFDHGGKALSSFRIKNCNQALSIFTQTACALAVAETAYQFEHRDLHADNILISSTKRKKIPFIIDSHKLRVTAYGLYVTLIDFTLSRLTDSGGLLIFFNLGAEVEIFNQKGDYQFEIYRLMKKNARGDWKSYKPYTNVLWLHYLLKFLTSQLAKSNAMDQNTYAKKKLDMIEKQILKMKNSKEVVEALQLNKKKGVSAKSSSSRKTTDKKANS